MVPSILHPQLSDAAGGGQHAGTDRIPIRRRTLKVDLDPMVCIALVAEQHIRTTKSLRAQVQSVGDEQIRETIDVIVGNHHAVSSANTIRDRDSLWAGRPRARNQREHAVAQILIQPIGEILNTRPAY